MLIRLRVTTPTNRHSKLLVASGGSKTSRVVRNVESSPTSRRIVVTAAPVLGGVRGLAHADAVCWSGYCWGGGEGGSIGSEVGKGLKKEGVKNRLATMKMRSGEGG